MSPPEKPIILVGMMGAGKTTVGRRLAEALGWDFVDSDRKVEIRAGKPVAEIFSQDGEPAFRALEREVMKTLLGHRNSIIAAGGGAFLDKDLRSLVLKNTLSIWLKADPDEMYQRAITARTRPLLQAENSRQVFMDLYQTRKKTYAKVDIIIECKKSSPDEAVRLILSALKARAA